MRVENVKRCGDELIFSSPDIIKIIKLRRKNIDVTCGTCEEEQKCTHILLRKPKENLITFKSSA